MKSYLCVGGPYAGKKHEAKGNYFRVPVNKTPKVAMEPPLTNEAVDPAAIETVTYREETFRTHQGDITFWIPEDQTWYETMVLLLEAYELTITGAVTIKRQAETIESQRIIIEGFTAESTD